MAENTGGFAVCAAEEKAKRTKARTAKAFFMQAPPGALRFRWPFRFGGGRRETASAYPVPEISETHAHCEKCEPR
jgi:hypothetical protein